MGAFWSLHVEHVKDYYNEGKLINSGMNIHPFSPNICLIWTNKAMFVLYLSNFARPFIDTGIVWLAESTIELSYEVKNSIVVSIGSKLYLTDSRM